MKNLDLKNYTIKIDKLDILRDIKDLQGVKGTIDQGDYMVGLYNGLELAISLLEGRKPEYKDVN